MTSPSSPGATGPAEREPLASSGPAELDAPAALSGSSEVGAEVDSPGRPAQGRRAGVVGCGLIGASIAHGLRAAGWHVTGDDADPARADRALAVGALDAIGVDPGAEITFLSTPVNALPEVAGAVLAATAGCGGVVTDVGSVKRSVVEAVADPRFVGGHPMAGSEQEGLEGAHAGMFVGATWVLTPTDSTDTGAFALVRSVVASLGADVVAVSPDRHDELVALVSHVPHLTAAALMGMASQAATEHATLLRLAAGGFRDMTRIAAGHPGIWLDICTENRTAILATLDQLGTALAGLRAVVADGDRDGLLAALETARAARVNLPARAAGRPTDVAEVRVPVPDRAGVLAEVTTLLGEMGINIYDLEIAHSAEGDRGVLLLLVDTTQADEARSALSTRGYRPAVTRLQ
ncbi:MAG: prephenate dehydrogenase/arogenate dehydrogenase family protein [Acidimicrobiales bacterium]